MKKYIVLFLLFISCIVFSSCNSASKDSVLKKSVENIQDFLTNLKSYHAVVQVEVYSNKSKRVYTLEQWVSNNKYRIDGLAPAEIKGRSTVWNDTKTQDKLPGLVVNETHLSKVNIEPELILTTFIKRYLQTEDTSIDVDGMRMDSQTVYEVQNNSGTSYFASSKLFMDNSKIIPTKLVIFNNKNNPQIVVLYKKFEYNKVINDNIFTVHNSVH